MKSSTVCIWWRRRQTIGCERYCANLYDLPTIVTVEVTLQLAKGTIPVWMSKMLETMEAYDVPKKEGKCEESGCGGRGNWTAFDLPFNLLQSHGMTYAADSVTT